MPATVSSSTVNQNQGNLGSIGRFQLVRLLGKGNQSEVYLAHDPHLDREVAIKTLKFATGDVDKSNLENLLAEARTVSRLQHPNIVGLYDAGEHEGQPYLVFELVNGPTLAQVLQSDGPVAPTRAAELALQILDAIGYAHRQGIIHRDLKPSNILLGANGVPRVMDFGVAGRIDNQQSKSGYLMGTPAYMAPEYITREEFGPQSDLFSFGMMMYEILTGKHAVRAKTVQELMYRIVHDPIAPPSHHNPKIDEKLNDIIIKVLRKEPSQRYADAGQLKNAFEVYLTPDAPDLPNASSEEAKQSTLEFLLRRMRLKSDFPALSESMATINRLTASDKESVNKLSNSILKDFALTNKLLKLVNAAIYKHVGGGTVSTISRAVVILGFDQVRSISLTLMMFESMQNKGHAQQLKEEFVKVLYAGMLARGMAAKAQIRDAEEAFVCSMFHNLGQLLAKFYFPEEAEEIEKLMAAKSFSVKKAAAQVLGLTYEDLGIGIAKNWGFPEQLIISMKHLSDEKVRKGATPADKLRVLAGFSNELCDVILCTPEKDREKAMAKLTSRFGESLPMSSTQIKQLMEESLEDIAQFAKAVDVNLKQSSFAQRASKWAGLKDESLSSGGKSSRSSSEDVQASEGGDTQSLLAATLLHEPSHMLEFDGVNADGKPQRSSEEIQAALAAGLQDISNSLVDEKITVNDILRMILETMYTSMNFDHVIFCIKDGRRNAMCGKFGFGDSVQEMLPAFAFPMVETPDVFFVALKNNADILIADIDDPKIASRIPAWYRQSVPAKNFLLFPIVVKGKPVGLIYADRNQVGQINIQEKELSLLKSLRNQAILAIRQSL